MPNTLDKIRLSAVTYDIVDSTAVHSLDGYPTVDEMNTAITASSAAVLETVQEAGYQTSGDVQNAISGKANSSDVVTAVETNNTSESVGINVTSGGTTTRKQLFYLGRGLVMADGNNNEVQIDSDNIPTKSWVNSSISGFADAVAYDTSTKYMKFYNGGTGGTMVYEFDASPFLIDGMVQNVEIKDVPITEAASTASTTYTFTSGATTEFVVKVKDNWWTDNDAIVVFTNSNIPNIDAAILPSSGSLIVDGYASGTSSGNTIYLTVTGSTAFDTAQMAPDWSEYESVEAVYGSVTCLVISFNTDAGKQDINIPLTEIFDPTNYYTKSEVDSALSAKTDNADFTAYTSTTDTVINNKADTTAVTAVNNVLTAHTADTTIHVTSSDKTTWSGKQDQLVSGTNIKSINGSSILGSGDLTVDTGLHAEVSGTTLIFS